MACKICGKAGDTEKGLCPECSSKLTKLTSTSGRFSTTPESIAAEAGFSTSKETSTRPKSRVVLEFGQEGGFSLKNPFSVAAEPDGIILVMDRPGRDTYRISRFAGDGRYLKTVVECGKGGGEGELKFPKGIASGLRGSVFVPDAGNNRIQRFDPDGKPLGPVGAEGDGPAEFQYPCDIEIDDVGTLYIADTGNSRIQKLTRQGVQLLCVGGGGGEVEFDRPTGVMVDNDHNIYVADTEHHRVVKLDSEGKPLMEFGKKGGKPGELDAPSDVRVDDAGTIFVADQDNTRVQKFDAAGKFLAEFSLGGASQTGGVGGDVAVDDDGCLIICDRSAHKVTKVELIERDIPLTGEDQ